MTKRDALIFLLEHYDELSGAGGGVGGNDDPAPPGLAHAADCRVRSTLRCTCWLRSLRSLDLAVDELRASSPVHCQHLLARYRYAERVQRPGLRIRNGAWMIAGNERVVIPDLDLKAWRGHTGSYDAVIVRWRPWVDPLIVAQALDRLEQLYGGEVRLPSEAVAA